MRFTIVLAILLMFPATLMAAATPTGTLQCFSGSQTVFNRTVALPVIVEPVNVATGASTPDNCDMWIATDPQSGKQTFLGGSGLTCTLTALPAPLSPGAAPAPIIRGAVGH
jgi:hypothetical protein